MSHLRLVPPVPGEVTVAPAAPPVPVPTLAPPTLTAVPSTPASREPLATREPGSAWDDPKVVALSFFQTASGLCLCRSCSMRRHPSYGG